MPERECASRDTLRSIPIALAVLLVFGAPLAESSDAEGLPWRDGDPAPRSESDEAESNRLRVGLRADTPPFSYRTARRSDERILPGYGGYMVEICRRVLSRMTTDGPFEGFDVVAVRVNASERFERLRDGDIDLLCGPDSITSDRLQGYNASHPLFLSGVTYATVGNSQLPRSAYCEGVVGLLEGTTAETEGLRALSASDELLRFDAPVDAFLTVMAEQRGLADAMKRFERRLSAPNDGEMAGLTDAANPVDPALVKTGECSDGHEVGPVVYYEHHDSGLEDLCNGKILYYLGDRDIIARKILDIGRCNATVQRETLTKEAYGAYFRSPGGGSTALGPLGDGTLYAVFNNVLLQKMQSGESILEYEFDREFGEKNKSSELTEFFDSFKYATDY